MARVTVEVEGLERVLKRLDEIGGIGTAAGPMEEATALVQREMMVYPPKLAGSTYRWTHRLGQSWTTRVETLASGVQGIVGNAMVYAPWVQDAGQQARVHQGRWQTAQAVLEKLAGQIVECFVRELRRLMG